MKTIEAVSIWDNGTVQEAVILNSFANTVILNTSATFWYGLFTETVDGYVGQQIAQGSLTMTGEAYAQWEVDSYAWDWVAAQLNLTITGNYVPPVPITTTTTEAPITTTTEAPVSTTTTTEAP
jgi:hypothetical protein